MLRVKEVEDQSVVINVDKKLQLSNGNLVNELKKLIKYQELPKDKKLKTVAEFPGAGILAQLASKAYANEEEGKKSLPDGWKLLTTASNKGEFVEFLFFFLYFLIKVLFD